VSNFAKLFALLLVVFAICAPAFAQEAAPAADTAAAAEETAVAAPAANKGLQIVGCAIGAGIIILGAGWGIGTIGSKAVEGTSRQPEAGGSIMTQMIISAALIEGVTFFALIVCFLGLNA
jgi:F-type H+-transporting ATPase subunit c